MSDRLQPGAPVRHKTSGETGLVNADYEDGGMERRVEVKVKRESASGSYWLTQWWVRAEMELDDE